MLQPIVRHAGRPFLARCPRAHILDVHARGVRTSGCDHHPDVVPDRVLHALLTLRERGVLYSFRNPRLELWRELQGESDLPPSRVGWRWDGCAVLSVFPLVCDYVVETNDGSRTPGFVGYDPSLKTIVVSHQGTNTSNMYVAPSLIVARTTS